jgi:hypothetical protein
MAVSRNLTLRTTSFIALAFAVLALLTALLSVYVMVSRPWGCSTSSASPAVSCDWVTSRWVGAVWLIVALAISLVSWKRWSIALAVISLPLVAFSLLSVIGIFTLAPAALWLGCALWQWSRDRRLWIVVSALATVPLLWFGIFGVLALLYLATAPI